MRLSWYANSKVAVFSIWQGNRCTGTFRLPFADLTRMVQALQAGPPAAVPAGPPGGSGYQDRDTVRTTMAIGDPRYYRPGPRPGFQRPRAMPEPNTRTPRPISQARSTRTRVTRSRVPEPQYREPGITETAVPQPEYQQPQYQEPQYQEPQYQEPHYQEPQYQEPEYGGWSEQGYGDSDTGADQPYGDHPYGQHGYQEDYSADPGYGRAGGTVLHQMHRRTAFGVQTVSRPARRANYAMPDYDPPAMASLRPVSSQTMAMATRPAPIPAHPAGFRWFPACLVRLRLVRRARPSLTRCGQGTPNRCPTPP